MQSQLYPALYAPEDGFVFVVTYGRSGSTLTQKLLNAIPGYQIRGENSNILYHLARAAFVTLKSDNLIWRREDYSKDKSEQKNFIRDIIGTSNDPWFGAELINPEDFSKSLANTFVSDILKPDPGIRVSGFKEIRWHEDRTFFPNFLEFVKDTFPKSKFIFQTRMASDVAKSSWWKNREPEHVVSMIAAAEKMYASFTERNPGICYTVQYERYAEGVSYAQKLYQFLGEDMECEAIHNVLNEKLSH